MLHFIDYILLFIDYFYSIVRVQSLTAPQMMTQKLHTLPTLIIVFGLMLGTVAHAQLNSEYESNPVMSDNFMDSNPVADTPTTKVSMLVGGSGTLRNGNAFIKIGTSCIGKTALGKDQPIQIYIQAEGRCKGIYVAKRSEDGFMVKELNDGKSTIPFSWNVRLAPEPETSSEYTVL